MANISLRYPLTSSSSAVKTTLADIGLTTEILARDRQPIRFEIRREAGTFACWGTTAGGRGSGSFAFQADPAYARRIVEIGLCELNVRRHVQAGMFDIPASFVEAIVASGFPHVTISQVVALKMFAVTPKTVGDIHARFPSEGIDDILSLGMLGVSGAYIDALRKADVRHLDADTVSALRVSGVDQAFVDALAKNGPHGLSIDQVAALHGSR